MTGTPDSGKSRGASTDATVGDTHIDGYVVHLASERRLAKNTCRAYVRDLLRLHAWCNGRGIHNWHQLKSADARGFAAALRMQGLSGRSIARTLSAARSFYAWMRREQYLGSDPFAGVSAPRSARRLPPVLSAEQTAALVDLPGDDFLAVRDRAMLELVYSCGLRLSELVSLEIDAIDLEDATVRVTGKGAKTRVVPIGRYAVKALRDWLSVRSAHCAERDCDTGALFLGQRGRRLGARSVQKRLAQWAVRQGLPVDVHPHMLRHAFASHMLESSGDLRAIQELLGHADIATTQVYTHLDFQHLAKVYDSAHPRARRRADTTRDKK